MLGSGIERGHEIYTALLIVHIVCSGESERLTWLKRGSVIAELRIYRTHIDDVRLSSNDRLFSILLLVFLHFVKVSFVAMLRLLRLIATIIVNISIFEVLIE